MVNYTQSWKFLKDCVSKIQDPTLRNQLDDWEKEFVADIEKANKYEIDTREEKRKKTAKEAHARMMQFIETGGTLADIPEDICTDTIIRLYHDCMQEYGDNLLTEADRIIGVQQ